MWIEQKDQQLLEWLRGKVIASAEECLLEELIHTHQEQRAIVLRFTDGTAIATYPDSCLRPITLVYMPVIAN